MRWTLTALAVLSLLAGCCGEQDPDKGAAAAVASESQAKTMTIGDAAPSIDIEHWVIGDSVQIEQGKIYVVEFWATWCGPCLASMPHLSSLQDEYGDAVTIVSVSDEPLETVTGFLDKPAEEGTLWRDKIHYTLTTDPDESVKDDYFRAAGQRGIPTAFIVGRTGQVEWIGHPMTMDEPLKAVVSGEWDRTPFKAEWEAAQEVMRLAQEAREKMSEAAKNGDWPRMCEILDELIAADPENPTYKMQKFEILLGAMNQPEQAYEYGRSIAEDYWDDKSVLNGIAWFVVDDSNVQTRDLEFAMELATRACELTEHKDAALLDTLARVYYEGGDLANAIKWQTAAVENVEEGSLREGLLDVLVRYEEEAGE